MIHLIQKKGSSQNRFRTRMAAQRPCRQRECKVRAYLTLKAVTAFSIAASLSKAAAKGARKINDFDNMSRDL